MEALVQAIRKGKVQVLCARPGSWLFDPSLVAAMKEQNATNPIRLVVVSSAEELAEGADVVSHVANTNLLRSLARNSTFVLSMGDASPALMDQALVAAKLSKTVVSRLPRLLPSNVGLYSLAVERDHDKYTALCAFLRDKPGRKVIRVPSIANILPMTKRLTGSGFHVAATSRQIRGIDLPSVDRDLIDTCKHNIIVVAGDHGYDSLDCSDIRHIIHYGSPVSARSVYRGMLAAGIDGHSSSYTALFSTTGTTSFRQQLLSRIPSLRGARDLMCEIFNDGIRSLREGESFHIVSQSLCHRYDITRGAFNEDVVQVLYHAGVIRLESKVPIQVLYDKLPIGQQHHGRHDKLLEALNASVSQTGDGPRVLDLGSASGALGIRPSDLARILFRELQWGIYEPGVAVSWAWQHTLEKVPRSEEDLEHLAQAVHRALCRPNEELLHGYDQTAEIFAGGRCMTAALCVIPFSRTFENARNRQSCLFLSPFLPLGVSARGGPLVTLRHLSTYLSPPLLQE